MAALQSACPVWILSVFIVWKTFRYPAVSYSKLFSISVYNSVLLDISVVHIPLMCVSVDNVELDA
jgi:hypothetical protein